MILRRVVENLKHHHWTSVFIELAIVVLGVFIGLQADNWNEARRDRGLEREYLERLHEDFALSIDLAERNIAYMQEQLGLEGFMVERLRECKLDSSQRARFARGIFLAGRFEPATLVRGTIDELRSSGRVGIIRNLELRRTMSNIVQWQERNKEVLGYIVARETPQVVYIDSRRVLIGPPGGDGKLESSADQVIFDLPALCADPAYIAAVSSLQMGTQVVISHNQARLADYHALLTRIEAEEAK
jgi:hypothetical protein